MAFETKNGYVKRYSFYKLKFNTMVRQFFKIYLRQINEKLGHGRD